MSPARIQLKPIKLVLSYARHYKLQLFLTIISMLLLVGVQLLIPWVIKTLLALLTDSTISRDTMAAITQLAGLVLLISVARMGFQFLRIYMSHIAGWSVVADIRKYIYQHIQRLSLRFYSDRQTGQIMSRIINDTDQFEELIAHAVPEVFVSIVTLAGVCIVLFAINWQLALLSLAPTPLLVLSMLGFAKYVRPAFRERQKELGNLNALLNDNISGIREIKAFTREEDENKRISHQIDLHRNLSLRAIKLMASFEPLAQFVSSLGMLFIVYFGGQLAFKQVLSVPDLVAVFLYLDMLYQPVSSLANSWEQIQRSLAGADRVADLLGEEPEVADTPGAITLSCPASGELAFNDVGFAYNNGTPVLENINLHIPSKSVVALVGPSGVGKTTLVSLIMRFYDVNTGNITLDGKDIRLIKLESLRQQVSMVLQDVFLFHGTVRDNILFGCPRASEADVVAAAEIANAHEFITGMPDGYDTIIGERGIKLSGGQKQRISIARAVLKDAPILVLDEATSAVDTETEYLIQQALERLITGRTTIIIAHRLSTIRNADKIVVLDGKHIVESGPHDELIGRKGLYFKLYTAQNQLNLNIA
jgi:ATP-binding cassette subfamily B protein/subfamily B ATP-binding cassette protein MsbA